MTAVLAGACGGENDPPTAADSREGPASARGGAPDPEALREAHRAALQRATPLTETALVAADPFSAWVLGEGPLRPRLRAPASLSGAVLAHKAADVEVGDIDTDLLSPVQSVRFDALHHGLRAIAEQAGGHALTRTDPMAAVAEIDAVLEALQAEIAAGRIEGLADAIDALEIAARVYHRDLGAATAASLGEAIAAHASLATAAAALGRREPSLREAAGKLARTLEAIRDALAEQLDALPAAADLQWGQWPRPADGRPQLRRLPPVLGPDELARRLRFEEAIGRPFAEAVPQLLEMLTRIRTVQSAIEGAAAFTPGRATPVTAARCEQALHAVVNAVLPDGGGPPELDCGFLRARWGDRSMSDAALTLAILDDALTAPRALARRRAAPKWVALQAGRAAPHAHRIAKSLAYAMQLRDVGVAGLAAERARTSVCLATTAIWIHGELPDRERLDAWLAADCNARPPNAWIDAVHADPRGALEGIGLTLAGTGPAGVTMLELVPWAPLGLVPPVANPHRKSEAPKAELRFTGPIDLDDPNAP